MNTMKSAVGELRPCPSPDDILAHPAFRAARESWIEGLLALYENDPFLNGLLTETMRSVVFFHILTLDAAHDPVDRTTWPTTRLLHETLVPYRLSSPRRIEAIVSRFVETGYVSRKTVGADGRVRLLSPTEKMLAHDLDWLKAYYSPLAVLFPKRCYGPPLRRDRDFRKAQRRISRTMLGGAAQLLASNPNVALFMNRNAGMMILIKLVQAGGDGPAPSRVLLTDLADRFGISRTHVRRVLQDAASVDLIALREGGVVLKPALVAAFDRFVADCLSSCDLLYDLATSGPEDGSADRILA